jgi:uncharacterized protein YjbI with pentapeptide repeats
VAAVFLGWALFVPAADWLARHDLGSAAGINLETARNNARGNLLALTAGLAGFGALVFTARNFTLQRRSLQLAEESQRRTYELTEQGQVTDRYTKAIEQLGSDKVGISIGGIYALERIAGDSVRDHPTVMEVLTAFIRERAYESDSADVTADIQAALSVLGRRNAGSDIRVINLKNAHLIGAELTRADLTGANLTGANLTRANLTRAFLTRADLTRADLTGANLTDTDLTGGRRFYVTSGPSSANLTGGRPRARLTGGRRHADLTGERRRLDLPGADLTDANLTGADLTRADLTRADLTDADLTRTDLTDVLWPSRFPSPAGWRINGAGMLERDRGPGES